jgi:predicted acyl esterase
MTLQINRITPAPRHERATEHAVRMRDGIRLATDVYLPSPADEAIPGPVILVRLPYDKSGAYTFMPEIALYMNARGYRVAVQDVRGKFRSEGETLPFVNEVWDGYDTIDWIIRQPWSDGVVGMWGDSYYGFTQWAAVSSRHSALRAIAPRVTGTDLGSLPAGASPVTDVELMVNRVYPITVFAGRDSEEFEPDFAPGQPLLAVAERYFEARGGAPDSWSLWYPRPVPVRRFPNGHPLDAPAIPVLQTIGWYDNCAFWQWRDHDRIATRPAWAACEYLLIEAIDHENYHIGDAPVRPDDDHAVSADARKRMLPGYLDPALDFFDVFLRGQGRADSIPKVRWELVHGEGLLTAESWPRRKTSKKSSAGSR